MKAEAKWTYEVHQLSEGFSAIVYDEHGQAIADHLSEERARLIAAAPDLLAEAKKTVEFMEGTGFKTAFLDGLRAAIREAEGSR